MYWSVKLNWVLLLSVIHSLDIIRYPLFADMDTGIYPHAASQYHTRPKAKRGIAMLSVEKFPYPRKQTRGNEFIPCSNNTCDILKRFHSFKIPTITLIWLKSPRNTVLLGRTVAVRKADGGRNRHCDVINDVPLSLYLTLMTSNVRYGSIFHGCQPIRSENQHGAWDKYIYICTSFACMTTM